MRELEVQLSNKDIRRMMSDMRLKKDGMKESKILAVMLIIAFISLIYTVGVGLLLHSLVAHRSVCRNRTVAWHCRSACCSH